MTKGTLTKMQVQWVDGTTPVQYQICLGQERISANDLVGRDVSLQHTGVINCIACGREIKKTFQQGYCYPCFTTLAETDQCIVSPELCHHHLGTCRDNDFAQRHCFIPHVVYLAVSSGVKVGITRAQQKITRWIDQGAIMAVEIAIVPDRRTAGFVEVALKNFVTDRTNWRRMLSHDIDRVDLTLIRNDLLPHIPQGFQQYIVAAEPTAITYPVSEFPPKISSYDLDKQSMIEDQLLGIKGQYLIFKHKVINLRKYQGYELVIKC